jgi:mono/diheme cytochrome c family protein
VIRSIAAVLTLIVLSAPVAMAGEAREGEAMAKQWCAECHVVGKSPSQVAIDGAPPFTTIAADSSKSDAYLRTWMFDTHPPMPNLELSRREIDDLVAYISTLRPR